jgi:pheromone shutdown-related protein TraB
MPSPHDPDPLRTVQIGNTRVAILGTAHVSRVSADKVRELLASDAFDAVAVELCPSRHDALVNPESLSKMDLFDVVRRGKAPMVIASLALAAYQQRLAEELGIEPGGEMRVALDCARQAGLPVLLIDREVGITLKRIYRNVRWSRRLGLVAGLLVSVVSRERVTEEEVEGLKAGDLLETTFSQFADDNRDLYEPLIDERDRYMAARMRQELRDTEHRHVLAVVGAGHLRGLTRYLEEEGQNPDAEIERLDRLPPHSRWPRMIPWLVVGLIVLGFVLGFARSPELGWTLVVEWVLINGTLAASGTVLAGGHPLTVLTAFGAAPLTSLNPTVGAGMATAAVEVLLRRPKVGDFIRLRHDTARAKGWWHNRVSRTLLVFLFSTLGSVIGTYVAGFRIFERLTS